MADGRCPGIGRRIRLCLAFFAAAAVGCKSGDAVNGDTALPDAALADVAAPKNKKNITTSNFIASLPVTNPWVPHPRDVFVYFARMGDS